MRPFFRTLARALGEVAACAILLFVVRFVLRGHLVPQLDEECTIGGAAVDLLAHGLRFPLPVYAPNDYENGFLYSALLAAASFATLGRNVLALKLPTHLVASLGVLATLWLLRACLVELGLRARPVRWTAIAVLVVATAFAPRELVFFQTWNVGVGSHAEGLAIDMILLAAFARWRAGWSTTGVALFWALVGFAVHVNRGALVLVPVLAVAELGLARPAPRRLAAVALGFLLGNAPDLVGMARAETAGGGWSTLVVKLVDHARDFPRAFVLDVLALADYRGELLATWALALVAALALLHARRRVPGRDALPAPSALGMTAGFLLLHLAGLAVMAQGGIDNYALHVHPPLVVLTALAAGWLTAAAAARWGTRAGIAAGVLLVALALVVHRPDALRPGLAEVSALWAKRGGAACSWRLGESFVRVQALDGPSRALVGAPALTGRDTASQLTREHRAIALCRSLSEEAQVLDCIGGVGRDAHFGSGTMDGEPPDELTAAERRAYAFYFGVRTAGDVTPCDAFRDPALRHECRTAVQLDCLIRLDVFTRFAAAVPLGRPRCEVPAPPMDGYWAEMRSDLLARPPGSPPRFSRELGEDAQRACKAVVEACY